MERQYVAIDLHRLRSLVVRESEDGGEAGVARIDNDPVALALAVAEAGPDPEVAIEATYGWYWAVDVLEEQGARVRLVNPSGLQWGDRRVKNDYRDCKELLDRMRLGKLPEAWIAPPPLRELRELVRYRHKLVCLRTGLKAQVKAVLAKHGLHPPVNDLWGLGGTAYLDGLTLDDGYHIRGTPWLRRSPILRNRAAPRRARMAQWSSRASLASFPIRSRGSSGPSAVCYDATGHAATGDVRGTDLLARPRRLGAPSRPKVRSVMGRFGDRCGSSPPASPPRR